MAEPVPLVGGMVDVLEQVDRPTLGDSTGHGIEVSPGAAVARDANQCLAVTCGGPDLPDMGRSELEEETEVWVGQDSRVQLGRRSVPNRLRSGDTGRARAQPVELTSAGADVLTCFIVQPITMCAVDGGGQPEAMPGWASECVPHRSGPFDVVPDFFRAALGDRVPARFGFGCGGFGPGCVTCAKFQHRSSITASPVNRVQCRDVALKHEAEIVVIEDFGMNLSRAGFRPVQVELSREAPAVAQWVVDSSAEPHKGT